VSGSNSAPWNNVRALSEESKDSASSFSWGEEETRYFFSLTPDRILDAVEKTGLQCTGRAFQLNSMENRVYDLEIVSEEKKSGVDSCITKFYRPGRWSFDQISEEHQFLFDLVEYDIPVVAPKRSESGETIFKLDDLDIYFSIFPKVGGRNPSELDSEQLGIVGRLLARLHNVGSTKEAASRIELSPENYGYQSLDFLLENNSLPANIEQDYQDLVEEICETSIELFQDKSIQRVHGDCHLGNLLWGDQGPFWVDFDDMCRAPCVQDIWLVVPGRDEESKRQLDVLLGSYEQMRSFDYSELELVEPLRTLRIVHFNAWIAKRWKDPFFPKAFPQFGTDNYWLDQLSTLREQADLIL